MVTEDIPVPMIDQIIRRLRLTGTPPFTGEGYSSKACT